MASFSLSSRFILLGAAFAVVAFTQPPANLYDEELNTSMPHRVAQWRQMTAYAESLPPGPAPEWGGAGNLLTILKRRTGYPPPALSVQGGERLENAGEDSLATYYRCWIRISPHMETYGLYLVPKQVKLPAPLVISQHGGSGFPELAIFGGGANYHDMIRGAVREGYVVYAPLAIDYPRRDEAAGTPVPQDARVRLDTTLRSKGTSLAAVEVRKIQLALDVLLKRKEVDPKRVAMIGLSYGCALTLHTAALDPRIRLTAPSCCLRDAPAAAPSESSGRMTILSSSELISLISPRPMHVQAGIKDNLVPIEGARRAIAASRDSCRGSPESLEFVDFDGGHEFRGADVWPFLRRHLKP